MSIDASCREQQKAADRMFMDFKYTPAGSPEQVRAIGTLTTLMSMWADFSECRGSAHGFRSDSEPQAMINPRKDLGPNRLHSGLKL